MASDTLSAVDELLDILLHCAPAAPPDDFIEMDDSIILKITSTTMNDPFVMDLSESSKKELIKFNNKTLLCTRNLKCGLLCGTTNDGVGIVFPTQAASLSNNHLLSDFDDQKELMTSFQRLYEATNTDEWFAACKTHPQYNQFKYSLPLVVDLLKRSEKMILNEMINMKCKDPLDDLFLNSVAVSGIGNIWKTITRQQKLKDKSKTDIRDIASKQKIMKYTLNDIAAKISTDLNAKTLRFVSNLKEYGLTSDGRIKIREEYLISSQKSSHGIMRKSFFLSIVLFHELLHLIRDWFVGKSPTPEAQLRETGYYGELQAYKGLFSADTTKVNHQYHLSFIHFWEISATCSDLEHRTKQDEKGYLVNHDYIVNCFTRGSIHKPDLKDLIPIPPSLLSVTRRARGSSVAPPRCGTHLHQDVEPLVQFRYNNT